MFVNPTIKDIKISNLLNTDCVEIHTGKLANLVKQNKDFSKELKKIKDCSNLANKMGIEVHAGHGLDYKTTRLLSKFKQIKEFNIGHFLIGESIKAGIFNVIKNFKEIIKK